MATCYRNTNALTMEVNMDYKFQRIFIFMDLKKPLRWLKNEIAKIGENLNETVKYFLK